MQVLPVNKDKSVEDFTHLEAISNTIKDEELLNLDANTVLTRLYHEDNLSYSNHSLLASVVAVAETKQLLH